MPKELSGAQWVYGVTKFVGGNTDKPTGQLMGIKYDITLPGVIDSFANDVRFQCSWRTAFTTGCAAFSEQCRDVPASGRRMGQFFTGRG